MSDLSTLPGLLEDAALGGGVVSILAGERGEARFEQLWRRSERAAACLLDAVGPAGTVALLMETSLDCLVSVLGAWRAGVTVLSLPYPARATPLDAYREEVLDICRLADVGLLVLPERFGDLAVRGGTRTTTHRACAAHPRRADVAVPGEFVQFSSGSTGRPRGVRLSSAAIATNVTAMIDHMAPHYEGAVACSWLPLSHDMGLIGTCLTILASMGRTWRGRRLALMPPERMVARPSRWLQACSEIGATVTCAPSFALDLVLAHPPPGLDLRALRVLVVGSEPIAPGTLRRFAEALAPVGFDELALCPAYGMAEAALAVTMVRPQERWRFEPSGPAGTEAVSCGSPLSCVEVQAPAGSDGAGPIAVRGRSLLIGYLGQAASPFVEGWLATRDLGFLRDGELYVVGRSDDVLVIAGRKVYPEQLEAAAARHPVVRPGNCAAIPDGAGGYLVVAERRRASGGADLREACRWIRREVSREGGIAPRAVVIVSPGSLPRTPSGKLQRRRLGQLHVRGDLPVEAEVRFARGGMPATRPALPPGPELVRSGAPCRPSRAAGSAV
jgi:acyl-CoA synthetase (AMP-forming)/AMP-acid ligase II